MASRQLHILIQHLRRCVCPRGEDTLSDTQLLERWNKQRDEAAFEVLLWRHGAMVLAVCRRLLRDSHDIEDAFQAAFLTLVRKGQSIRRPEALAPWLYRVAYRIALRLRREDAERTRREQAGVETLTGGEANEAASRDLRVAVEEEIDLLPERYRQAFVLCCLEGKTHAEAAHLLGRPTGTVSCWLKRGRERLRQRLTQRGLASAAALAAVGESEAQAVLPAALVQSTGRAATALTVGGGGSAAMISARVAALVDAAVRGTVATKLKWTLVLGPMLGLTATGAGVWAYHPVSVQQTPASQEPKTQTPEQLRQQTEQAARTDRYGDPLPQGALFRFGSVRMRHAPAILGSALSPDGKLLATTSGLSVVLWDLKVGKSLRRFSCDHHRHFTNPSLTFSPDGRHLGYVQSDDFACIWDVKDGKQVAEFIGGGRHHTLCQFSSDGKTFLFGSGKQLSFWDLHASREVRSLPIEDVFLLTPDARFGVRFDKSRGLRFIDTRSGEETGRLNVVARHNGFENGVAFSPDGKALAVVDQNKEVQVRGFPDGKLIFSAPLPASAKRSIPGGDYWEYQLSFPDRRTLMLGTSGGVIHRWDLAAGKEVPALRRHIGAVAGVHAAPEGKSIVTTGSDGAIRRWDRQTGRELSEPAGYLGRTHAVYSPDGRYVAVGDTRGRLELWNARIGRLLRVLQQEGPAITKLAVSSAGSLLAAARADNTVHFWTLPAAEEPRLLRCGEEHNLRHVWNMHFSPDGRRLLIADGRYHARLWEVATGKVYWRSRFGSAVFSPDGGTLAMVYVGPYLNLLDASSGKTLARLRQDTNVPEGLGSVPAMAFSPDGKHLAQAINGVYLCDARTGATIHHFQAADKPRGASKADLSLAGKVGEGGVHGLAFSPDGRWLATSGWDGSVRLWEVATRRQVLRFDGHAGDVRQIAFDICSRTLLSCGEDSQAYLWSLRPPMERGANPSLDSLWIALAEEPAKAYRTIWVMSETPEATAFLRRKLVPVKPVSNERLRQLFADLESDTFTVRDGAAKALAELGEVAAPAMRKALADKPPLETRKRLETLIQRVEQKTLTLNELRIVRALDVLERQGTAEAWQVLRSLAQGMPEARVTREAKTALERLSARHPSE